MSSRRGKGAFWTHNDGDNNLWAFTLAGLPLGKWSVSVPALYDWEDVAWSPGRIYIADIGNNALTNFIARVYAVPEPGPTFSGNLPLKDVWRLTYPNNQPFDSESLLIFRRNGYIIAKNLEGGEARVYRFPLSRKRTVELQPLCELDVDAPVGGADLTRDGNRLAIITEIGAYLFQLPGGIPESGQLEPTVFVFHRLDRMEGCAFTRDGLLVTAETGEILLFTHPGFKTGRLRP
ncbi:MAG TPA: hypothetical protein VNT99_16865 [Methylomirabilota bacterium]|nr:hypothetical protein [Methylomirabilota bacterium]